MALVGACDIATERATGFKRKATTLQNQFRSLEDTASRLSPLLNVLEIGNHTSTKNLDMTCGYLDSADIEPWKRTVADKMAMEFNFLALLELETVKAHIVDAATLSLISILVTDCEEYCEGTTAPCTFNFPMSWQPSSLLAGRI